MIRPSKQSCKQLYSQLRTTVRAHISSKQKNLIRKLNPLLRGWCNYHRHVASKEPFRKLAQKLYWLLRRWSKRRHPTRYYKWLRSKYYINTREGRVFGTIDTDSQGKAQKYYLANPAKVKIRRHVKIKGSANPHDKAWHEYFVNRAVRQMLDSLKTEGRHLTKQVWLNQEGKCNVCGQLITPESKWDFHHEVPKKEGGPDELENLMMLHPACHRQLHSHYVAGLAKTKAELSVA